MPWGCKKTGRKHTPITSEAQRGFFGAELGRKRRGAATRTNISEKDLVGHLKESKGKSLPARKKKKKSARLSPIVQAWRDRAHGRQ